MISLKSMPTPKVATKSHVHTPYSTPLAQALQISKDKLSKILYFGLPRIKSFLSHLNSHGVSECNYDGKDPSW